MDLTRNQHEVVQQRRDDVNGLPAKLAENQRRRRRACSECLTETRQVVEPCLLRDAVNGVQKRGLTLVSRENEHFFLTFVVDGLGDELMDLMLLFGDIRVGVDRHAELLITV